MRDGETTAMKIDIDKIHAIRARAQQLVSAEALDLSLERMAKAIEADLGATNPLVLCVMKGGVIPAAMLLLKLGFPLRLDYIHATRYRGATSGGELHWIMHPRLPLAGEHLLIVDDIFDEGITLDLIVRYCRAEGAASVRSAVVVEKDRARDCSYRPDYLGVKVADRYLFGAGMDYKEYLRNEAGIFAVSDKDL